MFWTLERLDEGTGILEGQFQHCMVLRQFSGFSSDKGDMVFGTANDPVREHLTETEVTEGVSTGQNARTASVSVIEFPTYRTTEVRTVHLQ
jgi:hypothetical protein